MSATQPQTIENRHHFFNGDGSSQQQDTLIVCKPGGVSSSENGQTRCRSGRSRSPSTRIRNRSARSPSGANHEQLRLLRDAILATGNNHSFRSASTDSLGVTRAAIQRTRSATHLREERGTHPTTKDDLGLADTQIGTNGLAVQPAVGGRRRRAHTVSAAPNVSRRWDSRISNHGFQLSGSAAFGEPGSSLVSHKPKQRPVTHHCERRSPGSRAPSARPKTALPAAASQTKVRSNEPKAIRSASPTNKDIVDEQILSRLYLRNPPSTPTYGSRPKSPSYALPFTTTRRPATTANGRGGCDGGMGLVGRSVPAADVRRIENGPSSMAPYGQGYRPHTTGGSTRSVSPFVQGGCVNRTGERGPMISESTTADQYTRPRTRAGPDLSSTPSNFEVDDDNSTTEWSWERKQARAADSSQVEADKDAEQALASVKRPLSPRPSSRAASTRQHKSTVSFREPETSGSHAIATDAASSDSGTAYCQNGQQVHCLENTSEASSDDESTATEPGLIGESSPTRPVSGRPASSRPRSGSVRRHESRPPNADADYAHPNKELMRPDVTEEQAASLLDQALAAGVANPSHNLGFGGSRPTSAIASRPLSGRSRPTSSRRRLDSDDSSHQEGGLIPFEGAQRSLVATPQISVSEFSAASPDANEESACDVSKEVLSHEAPASTGNTAVSLVQQMSLIGREGQDIGELLASVSDDELARAWAERKAALDALVSNCKDPTCTLCTNLRVGGGFFAAGPADDQGLCVGCKRALDVNVQNGSFERLRRPAPPNFVAAAKQDDESTPCQGKDVMEQEIPQKQASVQEDSEPQTEVEQQSSPMPPVENNRAFAAPVQCVEDSEDTKSAEQSQQPSRKQSMDGFEIDIKVEERPERKSSPQKQRPKSSSKAGRAKSTESGKPRPKQQPSMKDRLKRISTRPAPDTGVNNLPPMLQKMFGQRNTDDELSAKYMNWFEEADLDQNQLLSTTELQLCIKRHFPDVSPEMLRFLLRVLGLIDEVATSTSSRLILNQQLSLPTFLLLAELAERLIDLCKVSDEHSVDLDLSLKTDQIERLKKLFYVNDVTASDKIAVEDLEVEIRAAGLDSDFESTLIDILNRQGSDELSFLDYTVYMPLLAIVHKAIVENPLRIN